jgi:acyl-CoA dehydrogenase
MVVAMDLRRHPAASVRPGEPPLIVLPLRQLSWAAHADEVVALLVQDDDAAWFARIKRTDCEVKATSNIAGEPVAEWTPRDPEQLRRAAPREVRKLCDLLAVARSSAIAGAARRILDLTFAYTNERRQFGRAIFAFQAVQHELAELATSVQQLQALLHEAYARTDGSEDGHLWALAVATCAGLAAARAIRTGHQLHGAIGVTMEYELQRHTRRLMAWRDEGGPETVAARELGLRLRAAHPERVWHIATAARFG